MEDDAHGGRPRRSGDESGGGGGDNSARFNQMAMLYVRAKPYSEWYLCAFYIILHSSAIAFLLFFMIWVMSRPSHKLFVENPGCSGELVRLQESERPGNAAAAAAAAGNSGAAVGLSFELADSQCQRVITIFTAKRVKHCLV
uniref:TLC domain-containing protein n=1 Tax=Macrostomum lignano TaxID=282301 RepID=A0A1I8ICF3_9PLAT